MQQGGLGTKYQSTRAQNLLNSQFPSIANSSSNSILIVYQGGNVFSNSLKLTILSLNQTVSSDPKVANLTGTQDIYSIEQQLLDTELPTFINQIGGLTGNVTYLNSALCTAQQNLTALSSQMFQLQQGINSTAALVYEVPSSFVQVWSATLSAVNSNVYLANQRANATIFPQLSGEALSYYNVFFSVWNGTFQTYPLASGMSTLDRESLSISQSVKVLEASSQLGQTTDQMLSAVASGLNVDDWNQPSAITSLTLTLLLSQTPTNQSSPVQVNSSLLSRLYSLGRSPSNASLSNLTLSIFENILSSNSSILPFPSSLLSNTGISLIQVLQDSYNLGPSPSAALVWNLTSSLYANATSRLLASSPMFSVNSTSLYDLLSTFSGKNVSQVQKTVRSLISSENFSDYPLLLSRSVTQNFVSQDNSTMLVLFRFNTQPSSKTISAVENDAHNSSTSSQDQVYVTGTTVLGNDVRKTLSSTFSISIVPGVCLALLIAGILFMAPLAAFLPLVIALFSIAVTLPTIWATVVVSMKSQINFTTPEITTLVMLGLTVDYSVLQLKRTREERQSGKSKEDAVGISVKWAGQAVVTAGLAVVIAFLVLALAKIPGFSDVGYSLAIGVSILLAVSLTLLPSLEIIAGDKLFWPSLKRIDKQKVQQPRESRLAKLTQKTLDHKVLVAIVITVLAAASFYVGVIKTPTSSDALKLVPNYESNKGLTIITSEMGGSFTAPTRIVIATSTPIVDDQGQFNQTLLNQIEMITAVAANSTHVASVTSPTRPFGLPFNYSGINDMPTDLRAQYVTQALSQIGLNNKTATVTVGLTLSSESPQAISTLNSIESEVSKFPLIKGISVYYGGSTQNTNDTQLFIAAVIPEIVAILSVVVYVILFLQLRSAFTPLRLLFTVLCSVVFSLALLSLLFYHLLGLPIESYVPIFIICTMLGIGTDYDIFLVTRIREEALSGKSDDEAIRAAVSKVWIIILGLGLILSSVFASLSLSGIGELQEISLALSFAVLVDILVITLFFVPSLMGLAQKYNWWPSKTIEKNRIDKLQNDKVEAKT
jgi:RND superfamily putative drug exporter